MKNAFVLCALATSAFATTPVLTRATPDASTNPQQENSVALLQQPALADANGSTPANPSDLEQSRILHDGINWTIVPQGSVIYLPETLKSKVDSKPVGNLLPFDEFLVLNRSWITTNEVTFDQAVGNEPLLTREVSFWSKQDKMVVAVHRLGPISVSFADETLASNAR